MDTRFPIDLGALRRPSLAPTATTLSSAERDALSHDVALCRDAITFFTALSGAKGLSGHSGGAFDTVPEVLLTRALIRGGAKIRPVFYDEAGHRVATQYLLSVLDGHMPAERLLHHREYESRLPGHPERGYTPGVEFSSGRLGHMWAFVNGVALAHPDEAVVMLGSDGSQMEGDDAEAARLAVALGLNVKLFIDDNDVTIAGHPSDYLPGFDVEATLRGHGLTVESVDGEDLDALFAAIARAFATKGPYALVLRRKIAPSVAGAEGNPHAHEVFKLDVAAAYLEARGHAEAVALLRAAKPEKSPYSYVGSEGAGKNRDDFGKLVNEQLAAMAPEERVQRVRVFDNDLEGSCGLHHVRKAHPEVFVRGGIMERGNFSAAAGFGADPGHQGIFATFSAFLEMCVSEITMARLNHANVLAHFSHSGVDDMADNTCHFGVNSMFADGGLAPHAGADTTRLYFPADQHQFAACVRAIFGDPGLRFLFSTRAPVPDILDAAGAPLFANKPFVAGVDDVVRDTASGGWVVSFGETLHRALDAVSRLRESGLDVGLVNKATLNVADEAMMRRLSSAPFVLVAEGFNVKTGLGSRFGTMLLEHGFRGRYMRLGVNREGAGGLHQQMGYQGLDSPGIEKAIRVLAG